MTEGTDRKGAMNKTSSLVAVWGQTYSYSLKHPEIGESRV